MSAPAPDAERRQKLLLAVLVAGAVGYGALEFVHRPRALEVERLAERHRRLQAANQAARTVSDTAAIEQLEQRLAAYREQLRSVEALVPSAEQVVELLDAIAAEARHAGVELALLQPVGAAEEEFYTRRTYDLAVIGRYHDIGYFLARIGSLPRIITPHGLRLAVREHGAEGASPRLEARVTIETYVLPPTGHDGR
jgi:type IV pilus assembly protein PilO